MFRQERVGRHFQVFNIAKFRTMTVRADGPSITVGGDSRVTRVGRLLRRTKVDELAQLWNVLVGDMSLVGPRPEIPEYVAAYSNRYQRILSVRPGITDPASIEFRDEEAMLRASDRPLEEYKDVILPAKLSLSEAYVSTWTLRTDALLIAKTLRAIISPARSHRDTDRLT